MRACSRARASGGAARRAPRGAGRAGTAWPPLRCSISRVRRASSAQRGATASRSRSSAAASVSTENSRPATLATPSTSASSGGSRSSWSRMCARSVGGTPASSAGARRVSSTAPPRSTSVPSASQWSSRLRMNSGLPPAAPREHVREAVGRRRGREALREVRGDRAGARRPTAQLLAHAAHAELVRQLDDRRRAPPGGTCRAAAAARARAGAAARRAGRASSRRPSAGPRARARSARVQIASSASSISRSIRARVDALRALAHGLGVRALGQQPGQLHEPRRRALGERGDDGLARRRRGRARRAPRARACTARPGRAAARHWPTPATRAGGRFLQEGVDERALADARLPARPARAARRPDERGASAARSRASSGSRPAGAARPTRLGGQRRARGRERRVVLEDPALELARGRAGRKPSSRSCAASSR